jgi:glycerol uptake facilitator-like aquaporin
VLHTRFSSYTTAIHDENNQRLSMRVTALSTTWGFGLSLGGTKGYAINPARDLVPRIAHALLPIAGKGSSGCGLRHRASLGPVVALVWRGTL